MAKIITRAVRAFTDIHTYRQTTITLLHMCRGLISPLTHTQRVKYRSTKCIFCNIISVRYIVCHVKLYLLSHSRQLLGKLSEAMLRKVPKIVSKIVVALSNNLQRLQRVSVVGISSDHF